ncbi:MULTISPECIES: class I SAM-dependent DNA methyltransferase [Methylobacterium]|jgi:type I restriction enzyme M protein|uniref:class I SAM-dependent DNA methyltransferase n=1 Tax=Methylobacterium TaxID=407 RepID=UPI0008E0B79B|nr:MULTISPECIES: class I SAM-dependent DNA methyltransferase [Methylobacterium]MBZ6415978.1 type I restriction-modification system subunit M [Methylobacterium sp.]MBK3399380.1 SAM-dependent DNA methyltransferase [Methylobacterium ajmalii]MBK3412553.1 SAM-dependent DNA methyltransferase [Methylobacterium ajmalii]MBK3423147.1 SAM-dependent DNA methyltransferase [Methylobacterium ajmalii]SFF63752.1 type I restriction enzyme M protein [Methylobacterium sp. yr596]
MSNSSRQIVQKLWSYCSILRDDGLSYPDYVEQLTYLLFLKMAHEQSISYPEKSSIVSSENDWPSLVSKTGKELHVHYSDLLHRLGMSSGMLGLIFGGAQNKIRDPAKLKLLIIDLIDRRNWSALNTDVKGDAYEGLLERNAQDTKSGAGQYFTPRPVVDAIIECVQPQIGQTIHDPACGTAGFLIAAVNYLRNLNPDLSQQDQAYLQNKAIRGTELVPEVARLAAMNLLLHGIGSNDGSTLPIKIADSLSDSCQDNFDIILTNPPFGKRSSVSVVTRERDGAADTLTIFRGDFWVSTTNKELNFVQHVASVLAPYGRAAIVVPEGVLTGGGPSEIVRRNLLDRFDVHTLLRLPTGIFYAQSVNASVLFFDKVPLENLDPERRLWVYDLRTDMRFSMSGNRIEREDLDDFVLSYRPSDRTQRVATWSPETPAGRWRSYSVAELLRRDKASLDLSWINDRARSRSLGPNDLDELTSQIVGDLTSALQHMAELTRSR